MKGTGLQLDKTGDEVKGVGAQLQNVNVVGGRCDTALPSVYTQSRVCTHHHRETALTQDGPAN